MKTGRTNLLGAMGLGALLTLTAGCGTTDTLARRIQQNHEVYAGLSAEEKTQIDQGIITEGFSPDMVRMALGKPDRVIPGQGPGAQEWIYANLYSRDGNSIGMATKVTANFNSGGSSNVSQIGGSHIAPVDPMDKDNRSIQATFQVEPDFANERIKAESAIKVHVLFTEGTVERIKIVSDGRG